MTASGNEKAQPALVTDALPRIIIAGISQDPPGTVYQGHLLDALELNFISAGSAAFELNGKRLLNTAGHIYMYWPGDRSGGGKNEGVSGKFVCRWVKFSWPGADQINSITQYPLAIPRDTLLSAEAQRELSQAFDALIDAHDRGQPGWQVGAAGYLLALMAIIVRENSRVGAQDGGSADRRLAQACTYMEQNLARRIKISEVARAAHLAEDYFSRLFHRRLGESPLQYLIRLRIQEGRRLLIKYPGLTIREASRKAGFDDPKHFSRLFAKRYGLTPKMFRHQLSARGETSA